MPGMDFIGEPISLTKLIKLAAPLVTGGKHQCYQVSSRLPNGKYSFDHIRIESVNTIGLDKVVHVPGTTTTETIEVVREIPVEIIREVEVVREVLVPSPPAKEYVYLRAVKEVHVLSEQDEQACLWVEFNPEDLSEDDYVVAQTRNLSQTEIIRGIYRKGDPLYWSNLEDRVARTSWTPDDDLEMIPDKDAYDFFPEDEDDDDYDDGLGIHYSRDEYNDGSANNYAGTYSEMTEDGFFDNEYNYD